MRDTVYGGTECETKVSWTWIGISILTASLCFMLVFAKEPAAISIIKNAQAKEVAR